MGLSGSWLLFTGLIGAWIAAVVTVPKLKMLDLQKRFLTFPDFLSFKYNPTIGVIAAAISGIGYIGFTAGQILAGGKLASASIFQDLTLVDPLFFSILTVAFIVIVYTSMGGIKAVIYTDTIQWIILLSGLLLLGIPFAYINVGGWTAIRSTLPETHFSLSNVSWVTLVNWTFAIIPIWFIAMTLYQRVFSTRNVAEARKAFLIAGVFEYPLMAFSGVILGMLARVAFPHSDPEAAIPLMLNEVLPVGIAGFVLAAYFSAIMSTADSCLIAASGNVENDILKQMGTQSNKIVNRSVIITAVLGMVSFLLATWFTTVLDIVLQSYAFMVSGLLVPTLAAYFSKRPHMKAAMVSMFGGGGLTLVLIFMQVTLPYGLDPSIFGIITSLALYLLVSTTIKQ
ncbi:MAG: sodium:solute symporter family protein [Cytophagales bacterium]|nr:sodium:solute symporter family protein [Cytophagales bacterium]